MLDAPKMELLLATEVTLVKLVAEGPLNPSEEVIMDEESSDDELLEEVEAEAETSVSRAEEVET